MQSNSKTTAPIGCVRSALNETLREAHWQRGVIMDEYATNEAGEMAAASIVVAFLSRVPAGVDAGTLLAEVKEIANG